jgi:hypothetical protein
MTRTRWLLAIGFVSVCVACAGARDERHDRTIEEWEAAHPKPVADTGIAQSTEGIDCRGVKDSSGPPCDLWKHTREDPARHDKAAMLRQLDELLHDPRAAAERERVLRRIVAESLDVACTAQRECITASLDHKARQARAAERISKSMELHRQRHCEILRAEYPEKPFELCASGANPMTAIGDWGVEIAIPKGASSALDIVGQRHAIQLVPCPAPSNDELAYNPCRTVVLQRVAGPAPATRAEASKRWDAEDRSANDSDRAAVTHDEGTTAAGAFITARSFDVRVGFSSGERSVHTFRRITRVHAVFPIDSATHIECTGYWEQDVDRASDPALRALWDVCASMRPPRK